MSDQRTDRDLLCAFVRAADQGAFAALVDRYEDWLANLARVLFFRRGRADLADYDSDAVQETFIRLHRHAERLVASGDQPSVRPWLARVLRSVVVDLCRRARDPASALDFEPAGAFAAGIPAADAAALEHCLAELKSEEREVLELEHWAGFSVNEIAAALDTSIHCIYRRRRLGLESLLACVQGQLAEHICGGRP